MREGLEEAEPGLFELTSAARLDTGLEQLRRQRFDVILLDPDTT